MYTQCPECQIAFRVTAKVLQQAQGNVRCGGCGHAFNALHYLSEDMPDPANADEPARDELAETSKRLLETLDELAGPEDVRIEDTGIEWRVLDDQASPASPADERRYDDNSPLPDEYDDEDYSPPAPQRRESDLTAPTEEFEDRQHDLALSEPEDWTDILEEVSIGDVDAFAVEEELVAIHNELSSADDAAPAAEANEIRLDADSAEVEIPLSNDALTDEVPQLDVNEFETDEPIGDEESLIEEIEAVAVEIDGDLAAGEDEDDADLAAEEDEDDGNLDIESAATSQDEDDDIPQEIVDVSLEDLEDPADDLHDDVEDVLAASSVTRLDDEEDEIDIDSSLELALESDVDDGADETAEAAAEDFEEPGPPEVPEPTEEEMTVNMEIDEQLMAVAEGDDEFSKTLVGVENPEELFDENSADVETIIMEGEFIRSEVEKERLAAEDAARSQLDDPARLADTYALNREKYRRRSYDPPAMGVIAAIVALTLLLVGQYIHNSRDSLATFGFFQQTVAPIYRVFGSPVTPAWDIKGWQFEATSGSVDEEETQLTIVSRIVNRSEQPLPFPLVHVSLTNRFEDVMGSRVLDPADYLPDDIDPSELVAPGVNFNAVIVIEQPSPDATGFKLNVCYRVEAGVVRCALEDFK